MAVDGSTAVRMDDDAPESRGENMINAEPEPRDYDDGCDGALLRSRHVKRHAVMVLYTRYRHFTRTMPGTRSGPEQGLHPELHPESIMSRSRVMCCLARSLDINNVTKLDCSCQTMTRAAAAAAGALAQTVTQSPALMAAGRQRQLMEERAAPPAWAMQAAGAAPSGQRDAARSTIDWLIQSAAGGGAVTRGRGWAGATHWRYSEAAGAASQDAKPAEEAREVSAHPVANFAPYAAHTAVPHLPPLQ